MAEPPSPAVQPDPDRGDASVGASDLVPDAIEGAAHDIADSARAVHGRASRTAHTVKTSTGQAKTEATGRVVELGHAARENDPHGRGGRPG